MVEVVAEAKRSCVSESIVRPQRLIQSVNNLVGQPTERYELVLPIIEDVWGAVNQEGLYSDIRSALMIGKHW